jgi:uncharacterized zinc-type alcohol dehydrogenase-like protein
MKINAYAANEAGGELQLAEFDLGDIKADEVPIKVESCGLCHSDLSMLNNDWGISEYPLVLGHEVIGTVVDTGKDVTRLQVGQRVGLGWHARACQQCECCDSGDQILCADAQGVMMDHYGGFADYVRAQAEMAVPLPEGLDTASAGPLFCGGITIFNPIVQFGIKPTDRVAVLGIGGLGHMAIQFLNKWGCEVTALSHSAEKHDEALAMGAHHFQSIEDEEQLAASRGSYDFILSTINVAQDWNLYLSLLKPKGRLHFVGVVVEPLSIQLFPLLGGQKTISGSPVGSPSTIATMLDFAARHQLRPQIETFKFSQVNEALEHLRSGKARYRIVLEHG